jgi:type III restriction enzyme
MIKTLSYQQNAVAELVDKAQRLLNSTGDRRKLIFQAPTGSGKTVMASQMLDELTTQGKALGQEMAIIWIAPNQLHLQSYYKMKSYFTETRVLSPVTYDGLDHTATGYIHPGEVFFVNWESINKETNVMVREGEKSASIYDLVRRTQEEHHLPVVVVIDEEHMFGGRLAKQSENVLKKINPKLEIRISATPITKGDMTVSILREDVIQAEMIKDGITINPKLEVTEGDLSADEYLLDQALARRGEIKKAYDAQGVRINPLLLIQLPNDNTETLDERSRQLSEMVQTRLKETHGISTENHKLAIWLSNMKENLEDLEASNAIQEALLFKQAIALGWDCPRAAVLLIFRDIHSETFGVQTVGRILRMPEQKYYPDELLNHGWVYTNLERNQIKIEPEDFGYINKTIVAKRRMGLRNVALPSAYSEYKSLDRNRLNSDFYDVLVTTFYERWFQRQIQMQLPFSPFDDGNENDKNPYYDGLLPESELASNIKKAEDIGINFNVTKIQIQLLTDAEVRGEAGEFNFDQSKTIKYARTMSELQQQMVKFCMPLVNGFEKQCAVQLREYLYQFMENHLNVPETDAPRIILYHQNRSKFEEVLRRVMAIYTDKIQKRKADARKRSFKLYTWQVPPEREYNDETNHPEPAFSHIHAMIPFCQLNNVSKPEKQFEQFLDDNKDCLDWWYKNGDDGKQHYAVNYVKDNGEPALFYVDFIIRMKNGQVFLFDTKSQASDIDAPAKHNALLAYMGNGDNAHLHLMGGVIIQKGENWYYSRLPIENTDDITNWDAFHPDQYEK